VTCSNQRICFATDIQIILTHRIWNRVEYQHKIHMHAHMPCTSIPLSHDNTEPFLPPQYLACPYPWEARPKHTVWPFLEHFQSYQGDKTLNHRLNPTGQVCNRLCVGPFHLSGYRFPIRLVYCINKMVDRNTEQRALN
jgi:hypothetical protein